MTAVLDKYGRILIPKKIREAPGLHKDVVLQLRKVGNKIIIESFDSDSLYKEEDDFLVYTGLVKTEDTNWIQSDRASRDEHIPGT